MKRELEFHQLEAFIAVARARNFTRAASELHTSQSSLSRAVQKLEEQIGQPLFERQPREVVLTDVGELLLDRAKRIMELVEDTFAEVSESGKRGRIRLAAIPTIAPFYLPKNLSSFAKAHPDVSIVVQEDTTRNVIRRCSHGDIDLAILALPIDAQYLETEPLFEEELTLVTPTDHPLARQEEVRLADIEPYPLVMLDEAHCLSDQIASFCRRELVQPISVERTSQLATVQELVSLGHGLSLVPRMAQQLDHSDTRTYRAFSGERPTREIAMLWNPYRYQSKWVKLFQQHLRVQSQSV